MKKLASSKAENIIGGLFLVPDEMSCTSVYKKENPGNQVNCYRYSDCSNKFGDSSVIREVVNMNNCLL
ncbi:hypothetical protein ACQ86O_23360 [Serratia sp. L9]|uniref:hypothetical protein n=1 Tax=Serratia sp. L9 TaxID=3423946 RepID=UPI003D676FEB